MFNSNMAGVCTPVKRSRLYRSFPVRVGVIILFGVLLYFCLSAITRDVAVHSQEVVKIFPTRDFRRKEVKQILMWEPFLSSNIVKEEQECMKTCDVKCTVTGNKDDIANSDAVDFHLSNLWPKVWHIGTKETIQFPTYRTPDQVWMISNLEPPPHLWGDLSVFNGVFNWTRWYRMDGTLPWHYGKYRLLNITEQAKSERELKSRDFHKEKTRGIMLRISNCVDTGRRYRIIREMSKYLDIDKYGLCYNNPCGDPKNQWDTSCKILMKTYRFYLAFENDGCKDYVTEKYWWTLNRDQIPIVNWKKVNKDMVIPNSYINIYDFKDVKSLTDYITMVNNNATLYNSYFKWRKYYTYQEENCQACITCRALHDETRPAQTIQHLDRWVQDDVCPKVGVWSNIMKSVDYYLFKIFGI